MDTYFESVVRELSISSLECDITLEKTIMATDYLSDMMNIYLESGNSDDTLFIEAGNKIGNAIKKACDAVIKFIKDCIDKIQEAFAKQRIKALIDKFNKVCDENPDISDAEIEYEDFVDEMELMDESCVGAVKRLKAAISRVKYLNKDKAMMQDIKNNKQYTKDLEDTLEGVFNDLYVAQEKISESKKKMKKIKIGAAIALLSGSLVTGVLARMKTRNDTLNDIASCFSDDEFCNPDNRYVNSIQQGFVRVCNFSKSCTNREKNCIFDLYAKIAQKTGVTSNYLHSSMEKNVKL